MEKPDPVVSCHKFVQSRAIGTRYHEIVNMSCKDDSMAVLLHLPHAFLVSKLGATFGLVEFAHGSEPCPRCTRHAIKGSLQEVAVFTVFGVACGDIDFSILFIARRVFPLCTCLRDVNMISVHIALSSDDE
jgi:hypothetical protein